jgi:hypothetical protein
MLDEKTIVQGSSVGWYAWHELEDGSLADLTTGYACSITVIGTAIDRPVTALDTTVGFVNKRFVASLQPSETTLIAAGNYIVSIKISKSSIGFSEEAHGILTVESSSPNVVLPTDIDTLKADLAAVRAARISLAAGNRIEQVWRDGRRITKGTVTLQSLNDLILVLDGEVARLEASTSSSYGMTGRTRSAIAVTF